jgi:hypothetical protein
MITIIEISEGQNGFYIQINGKKVKTDDGNIRWFSRRCDASRVARRMVPDPKLFRLFHWYAF